jgi:hypothetical protein
MTGLPGHHKIQAIEKQMKSILDLNELQFDGILCDMIYSCVFFVSSVAQMHFCCIHFNRHHHNEKLQTTDPHQMSAPLVFFVSRKRDRLSEHVVPGVHHIRQLPLTNPCPPFTARPHQIRPLLLKGRKGDELTAAVRNLDRMRSHTLGSSQSPEPFLCYPSLLAVPSAALFSVLECDEQLHKVLCSLFLLFGPVCSPFISRSQATVLYLSQ